MRLRFLLFFLALSSHAAEPPRIVTTIAGIPGLASSTDGPAEVATFSRPTWLDIVTTAPSFDYASVGDIFVVDRLNSAVRRISGRTVSTEVVRRNYYDLKSETIPFDFGGPFGGGIVIENPTGGCGSGPWARGMYVASSGSHQIVLVAPLSTVTGIGNRDEGPPFLGAANTPGAVDGHWSVARFNAPTGLARSWMYGRWQDIGRQSLFVADTGNHTIRQIRFRYGAEGCPVSDEISTLAGAAGQAGSQDGIGAAARFNTPRGVAAAPDGSVYVADSGNHTIRRIAVDGSVTTVAGEAGVPGMYDGPATMANLNTPSGIDVDSDGNVFICDTGNHTIRELTRDGRLITIAGTPGVAGFADGDGAQAKFNGPVGVKVGPDGALIVADTSNYVIRRIVASQSEPGSRRRSVRH
jgi:hypothetical protein